MLIPLALINIAVVAAEVLIWREFELDELDLWRSTALINLVLAVFVLIAVFFRMLTASYYRLPTRVRLVHDISVPSLPAPGSASQP